MIMRIMSDREDLQFHVGPDQWYGSCIPHIHKVLPLSEVRKGNSISSPEPKTFGHSLKIQSFVGILKISVLMT
jgi:hypothetical protein